MSEPSPPVPGRLETVQTLLGGSAKVCPVCRERPIEGRQTACSARCRAVRWRQGRADLSRRREAALTARVEALERRDREAQAVLDAFRFLADVALRRRAGGGG